MLAHMAAPLWPCLWPSLWPLLLCGLCSSAASEHLLLTHLTGEPLSIRLLRGPLRVAAAAALARAYSVAKRRTAHPDSSTCGATQPASQEAGVCKGLALTGLQVFLAFLDARHHRHHVSVFDPLQRRHTQGFQGTAAAVLRSCCQLAHEHVVQAGAVVELGCTWCL